VKNRSSAKIGLFGGSFNPIHKGHLKSIQSIAKEFALDRVFVIPSNQNPLKPWLDEVLGKDRLEMVRVAVQDLVDLAEVDDQEILRGGLSYTHETIADYCKRFAGENIYLIVGMDVFSEFDEWKNIDEILSKVNVIVTSRPGVNSPQSQMELPSCVRNMTVRYELPRVGLQSDREVIFFQLDDVDISAQKIRMGFRKGKKMEDYLSEPVIKYLEEHPFYKKTMSSIESYTELTLFCAEALSQKKALDLRGFDFRNLDRPSEFTLIASGTSTRHAASLGESVLRAVKTNYGVYPQGIEGMSEGRWILLDYGSLIVHVFYDFVRVQYNLEELWGEGEEISLKLEKSKGVPGEDKVHHRWGS